ncbi:MAG: metallophosphoesterase [Bacteroidota bacterium]
MKTVSIGDTHGVAVADVIVKIIDKYDKFIFVGDYVDSFDVDNLTMKKNLLEIIELKKQYPEKIRLLWGNHDIQYLLGYAEYGCTGYRPEMQYDFYEIFHSNADLFRFSYQTGDYLWTHAGVHAGWFEYRFKRTKKEQTDINAVSEFLNIAFSERYPALFDVGYKRGGIHNVGGPLWCDKTELESKPLEGVNQIVGHTRLEHIQKIKKYDTEIAFIDILENEETVNTSSFYYKEI